MSEISYVNTVNVTVSGTPTGLSAFVVANIGLFSNEEAPFADEYRLYVSPGAVAKDWGSDSLTARMATKMFAQTPNLRTGGGSLYIAPYKATNATSGHATTPNIFANIDAFKAVTNGEFIVTADGVDIKFSKLNFTGITTVQDIVKVLLSQNPDVFIEAASTETTATIKFKSKGLGTASTIAFKAVAGGTGTSLIGSNYLNTGAVVPVAGTNAVDVEKFSDAVARVGSKVFFGGVEDTCFRENDSVIANATAIEAMSKKVYVEVSNSLNNAKVLADLIKTGAFKKTRILGYSLVDMAEAKCMAAAYLSRAMATNYSGSKTCITMNLKELATVTPDYNCDDNILSIARQSGFDIVGNTSGLNCTYSTKSAGGYMDDQTGIAAFTGAIEVKAFNYLRQINTKVAQTEEDMTGLKNALGLVCQQYVDNNFFGKGLKWNSAEKFGDPEDFDRNIKEKGYYIYSLPIADQDPADRADRIAPMIQIAAKSAGAIHIINVYGVTEA